jgi:hypothetical protein
MLETRNEKPETKPLCLKNRPDSLESHFNPPAGELANQSGLKAASVSQRK